MKKIIVSCLIVSLILGGCGNKFQSKQDILKYISNTSNGLKKDQELNNNIKVSMTYIPYKLLERLSKQVNSSKLCFFSVRFSKNNSQLLRQLNYATYSDILQVLSFKMLNYVKAYDEHHNSIKPVDSFYQQTFGMTNYDELLFVFNANTLLKSQKFKISIDEFGLNLGSLDFEFLTKDIVKLNDKSANMI